MSVTIGVSVMNNESIPAQSQSQYLERQPGVPSAADDPDLARLIELVERIGGHGEQPL